MLKRRLQQAHWRLGARRFNAAVRSLGWRPGFVVRGLLVTLETAEAGGGRPPGAPAIKQSSGPGA